MKKIYALVLPAAALLLVTGLFLTGCPLEEKSAPEPDVAGTLTVTGIPAAYINSTYYVSVHGNKNGGGDNSGLFSGGASVNGDTVSTLPVTNATMNIPLVKGRNKPWKGVWITVCITTDTTYSTNGSSRPQNITLQRVWRGEGTDFDANDKATVSWASGSSSMMPTTGTLTVTGIPDTYINTNYRISVQGNRNGGGNGSGLFYGGESGNGNTVSTLLITSANMDIPLVIGRDKPWKGVWITVCITTDTTYSTSGNALPQNITHQRVWRGEGTDFDANDKATVSWASGSGSSPMLPTTGTLTVTDIPTTYIGGNNRISVQGNKNGGGNDSGLFYGGESLVNGNTVSTLLITSANMDIPLVKGRDKPWQNVWITVCITTDETYSLSGNALPQNRVRTRLWWGDGKNFDPEDKATVSWESGTD